MECCYSIRKLLVIDLSFGLIPRWPSTIIVSSSGVNTSDRINSDILGTIESK